jgi:mannosyltransferase OCH1-like enzyme
VASIDRVTFEPRSLTPRELLRLQRTVGNQTVARLFDRGALQRKPLNILAVPGEAETELDSAELDPIRAYVVNNLRLGRRDLVNILLERVRTRDPESEAAVQKIVAENADEFSVAATRAVPNTIHAFWMGKRISATAVQNIQNLHKNLGKNSGLTLWTDSRKRGYLETSEGEELLNLAKESSATFQILDVDTLIDPRISKTYLLALKRDAYSMASDLARYSILLKRGGIYMDVDLTAGEDVDLEDLRLPAHGLPVLGPNIRDVKARGEVLSLGLPTLAARGEFARADIPASLGGDVSAVVDRAFRAFLGQDHEPPAEALSPEGVNATLKEADKLPAVDKNRVAAQTQYLLGRFSNQFIGVPPDHAFMDFLIGQLAATVEKREEWDPLQVAALTGPSFFSTAIEGFYRSQFGIHNLDAIERRHMVEPEALARVVNIQWLTAESENQLGKEEPKEAPKEEPRADPSRNKMLAVVGAVVGIAAMAAWIFYVRGKSQ